MGFIFTVYQRSLLPVVFMIASIVYMKLSASRLNRLVSYVYERERDMISLIGAIGSSLMNERNSLKGGDGVGDGASPVRAGRRGQDRAGSPDPIRVKSQRIPLHTFPYWRSAKSPPRSRRSCWCLPALLSSAGTALPPIRTENDHTWQGSEVGEVADHVHVQWTRVECAGRRLVVRVEVAGVARVSDFGEERDFRDLRSVHALVGVCVSAEERGDSGPCVCEWQPCGKEFRGESAADGVRGGSCYAQRKTSHSPSSGRSRSSPWMRTSDDF